MTPRDRDALKRAFNAAIRRDPGRAWMLRKTEEHQGWERAAKHAAYIVQMLSLHLRPWEMPPCKVHPGDRSADSAGGVALLKKLRALGLSKYEPDVLHAISEAEQAKAARA